MEQRIVPLDKLLKEKRVPILFIGAGITRRYCNTVGWNELLERIAAKTGIDRFQLNGMRKKIESDNPGCDVNPALATVLRRTMIDQISSGRLSRSDFPELSDGEWVQMETLDPFKVLVCNLVSRIGITDKPELVAELDMFRKLSRKIPAVITTNYDGFLEHEVFTEYSVLVFPDDYYFSDSDGYGDILKIHGTVERPDTIVITSEDYDNLKSMFRPGHADMTYTAKFGVRDYRGGGRASGRETAARVAAGAVARCFLERVVPDITVTAFTLKAAGVSCASVDFSVIEQNAMRAADLHAAEEMMRRVEEFRRQGDSCGGIIECRVSGFPAGAEKLISLPVAGKSSRTERKDMLFSG